MDGHLQHFIRTQRRHQGLIIFICWGIWKCRNALVFEDILPNRFLTCSRILNLYKDYWKVRYPHRFRRRINEPLVPIDYPAGFFDVAAQAHSGRCGFRILLSDSHYFSCWMGIDHSTNNVLELVAAWACLFWAR